MKKISELITKFRWPVVIFFILITALFAMQIPKAVIDGDVKSMLPKDMPSRVTLDKIEDIFGGTEMAMIIFESDDVLKMETLKRMKKISRKAKRIKGVDKVLSLFELKDIRGEDGSMIVNPAVDRIPSNDAEKKMLKNRLIANDIVYGSVISKDFKAAAVIAMVTSDAVDSEVVGALRGLIKKYPGPEKIHYGGLLVTRVHIAADMQKDMKRFMPLGIFIMLIFLYFCFRQIRGVLLPLIVVIMSIIVSMGLIPILGWKIQMVTILLPVILIAIANDYGIHLLSKYQEDNAPGNSLSENELAQNTFLGLGRPVLATGVTTIAGMLCLLTHIIIPAEQLGVLASAGIFFALFASLLFIPAVLSILPKAKPVIGNTKGKTRITERMLYSVSSFVTAWPKQIITAILIITLAVATGINFIVVDTNPENYYSKDSPVVQATQVINKEFGGTVNVSVVATGDAKDPVVMNKINRLEQEIKKMPEVGNTTSLARVIRQMSRALNDRKDSGYDRIPDSRNAIAQYFELYSMSGDPDDFEKLVDFPYENSHISARINDASSETIKRTVKNIEELTAHDTLFTKVGGFASIFSELVDKVVRGQVLSLLLSVMIVAFLVALLFRSPFAGILSSIPLVLALILLFGLMGYAGIELNIATAMLSSIMVGVGVDYTIHFLWRYRDERALGLEPVPAVQKTLLTTGRGIVFNALSVIIGFTVLLVSSFMPIKFFGFLVVISISACLIGALVLLPSICIVFRPKFLEPKQTATGGN